jgi:anion-transporting  ArsA/GET3 family ATPase
MTATVYAFANQKGGVGKTTSTLSVAPRWPSSGGPSSSSTSTRRRA